MLLQTDFANVLTRDMTREVILVQAADLTPIYASMTALGRVRKTMSEKFEWSTDSHKARRTQIDNGGAAYDGATTTLTVDDSSVFYPDCHILCEATGEVMHCLTIASATSITVRRGVGAVVAGAAGSVANNAYLTNIGPANGEGAILPDARGSAPTPEYNYVQTFRQVIEMSGRKQRIGTLTEDELPRQRKKKFEELLQDFEHSALFGARDNDTVGINGRRVTSAGGALQFVTNVDNVGGTMTMSRFKNTFCEKAFAYGSREKVMFAGNELVGTIQALGEGKLVTRAGETALGLVITEVPTPWGILKVVPHRGMVGIYAQCGLVLDLAEVEIRHTEGGLPYLKPDQQAKGQDSVAEEWFAEQGWEWGQLAAHYWLKGVTGPA